MWYMEVYREIFEHLFAKFELICIFFVQSNGVPSATDQKAIEDLHNALRRKVATGNEPRGRGGSQPPAANMRQVKWDASLANAALNKTNLCQATAITSASAGKIHFKYGLN